MEATSTGRFSLPFFFAKYDLGIIEALSSSNFLARLAKKHNMSRSCLQYWRRHEEQIRASVASGHGSAFKVGKTKFDKNLVVVFYILGLVFVVVVVFLYF